MKKLTALFMALALSLLLIGCSKEDEKKINFPFEASDVKNVEMFNYDIPTSAKKKVVTETADIEALYNKFALLSLSTKKAEELTGAAVYSFRFNLSDGTDYELIYIANGIKNGILKSPTADFEYFTAADIGWNWAYLNEDYVAVPAMESELPGYRDTTN